MTKIPLKLQYNQKYPETYKMTKIAPNSLKWQKQT